MSKFYVTKKEGEKTIIELVGKPTLFKYQEVNEYSVQALLDHKIYGTTPSSFNDAYDTMFCYRKSLLIKQVTEILSQKQKEGYTRFFNVSTLKNVAGIIIDEVAKSIHKELRNNYVVSCFSEDLFNDVMWGQYANKSSGFVTEYDGGELFSAARTTNDIYYFLLERTGHINIEKKEHVSLIPVIYNNQKINCEEFIIGSLESVFSYYDNACNQTPKYMLEKSKFNLPISVFNSHRDELDELLYDAICRKKKSWSYEKEWRVWAHNISSITYVPGAHCEICVNIKPKAIYLGENISQYNTIALCAIAKEMQIPVYKMRTAMTKTNCKLAKDLIQPT